jgi:hypothetical protein
MNMSIKYIAGMIGIAAVVTLVLAVAGVPWATILPLAFILACPLMMIGMMVMMGGMGANHGQSSKADNHADSRN